MRKTLLSVAAALFCVATSMASSLKVVYLSGGESSYELAKIQYIDFRNADGFSIVGNDGRVLETTSYDKSRKIVFGNESGTANTNAVAVQVYPNPTQDALFVSGAEKDSDIQIYNMQGKVIFQTKASAENVEIPVSNYINGTYLLKVGNKVVKIVKD